MNGGAYSSGRFNEKFNRARTLTLPPEERAMEEEKYLGEIVKAAEDAGKLKEIDPLENLRDKPVFVFGCEQDTVVDAFNQVLQKDFYEKY